MPERDGGALSSDLLASPRRHGAIVLVGTVAAGIVLVSLLSHGPL